MSFSKSVSTTFVVCCSCNLRLVFSSNRVRVGVMIRSAERCNLVKIKPTSEVGSRIPIPLMTVSLTIKWKLHCWSRKEKQKNKPITVLNSRPSDELVLLPPASYSNNLSFHWIISDRVIKEIRRNGNILIPPTLIPSSLWLCLRLWLLIFTRS